MARNTVSLLPSILRLLIAAAIAGVLSLCSPAIERMEGFQIQRRRKHTQDH